ncbi:TonB-dependent receptor [Zunongwangia endophytica]|uniref:Carboxypeptidase-like regulatory domain-containing protein n=1 Tax=Zunongwangia endophytica TaxID=1808945 RepID=A0ABV8H7V4_9FLAO|nr:TonB-dependent receptor [Zunongwangia endophytica]MDN3595518.1 TonB-dependent receptor [Zunongwangia endophytica]
MKYLFFSYLFICSVSLFSQNLAINIEKGNTINDLKDQIESQSPYKLAYTEDIKSKSSFTTAFKYENINVKDLINNLNTQLPQEFKLLGNNITVKQRISNNSQKEYVLSGIISDEKNVPLMGATVSIPKLQRGTTSNFDGEFSIKLPQDTYQVNISFLGYQTITKTVSLDKDRNLNIQLEEGGETLKEVVIEQNGKAVNIKKPQMSMNSLTMNEIKQIPVAMGEPDPLKSLLTLPGVTNAGEGSSGFNVRGGAADQNLILLDDVPIYSDSHLFGFFSVFNADAVRSLDLYKGGIPSKYGGRVSSVLDIKQANGDYKDYKFEGGIGLISSHLKAEGPIIKDKASFMIAGRSSYAHIFLVDNSAQFYDLNTKLNYRLNKNNSLSFSGYFGNDLFDIGDSFATTYGNTMGKLNWKHRFNEDINTDLSVFYSDYQFNLDLDSQSFDWDSAVTSYGLKYDWNHYLSEAIQLNYGLEATYYETNPGTLLPKDESSAINFLQLDKKYAFEPSAYIDVNHKISEKLNLRYGLRYSMFYRYGPQVVNTYANNNPAMYNPDFNIYEDAPITGSTNYDSGEVIKDFSNLEPRAALSYALNDETSFKASYNRMAQYMHIISNSQSPTPVNMWTPSGPFIKPQLLDQYALGYFRNFSNKKYSLETEAFYKDIKNRVDYVDGADLIGNNNIEQVLLSGKARAYGMEFLFRKNTGKLTGWLSYTISRAEQRTEGNTPEEPGIANGDWYFSPYDKLHNLSFVANYEHTEKWSFSANFSLQSGQPVTYPNGYYELGGIHVPNYSKRNENRLPTYHHLDLAATYTPKPDKKKGWQSYWVFSLYNAYNRQNAASVRFTTNEDTGFNEARRLSIFGAIPSVSYNFKF